MKLGKSVIIAHYLSRPNRFTVLAKHQRRLLGGDFPNPGRLKELLKPNSEIAINHCHSQVRRTQFDFVAISTGRNWISIDSRIPNELVHVALKEGRLPGFRSYSTVIPEKMFGNSRFDFLLSSRDRKYLL